MQNLRERVGGGGGGTERERGRWALIARLLNIDSNTGKIKVVINWLLCAYESRLQATKLFGMTTNAISVARFKWSTAALPLSGLPTQATHSSSPRQKYPKSFGYYTYI